MMRAVSVVTFAAFMVALFIVSEYDDDCIRRVAPWCDFINSRLGAGLIMGALAWGLMFAAGSATVSAYRGRAK